MKLVQSLPESICIIKRQQGHPSQREEGGRTFRVFLLKGVW